MPNYAIHNEKTVINVVVADSKETAEQISGLLAIETNGRPWTGWIFDSNYGESGGFVPPKPKQYPSWVLNYETLVWQPPTPMPETGLWIWDEETLSWITPS